MAGMREMGRIESRLSALQERKDRVLSLSREMVRLAGELASSGRKPRYV